MIPDLKAAFAKFQEAGEGHQFDRVCPQLSSFREVHAILLIEKLTKKYAADYGSFAFAHASHDEVWLNVRPDHLAECAEESDICDLVRCGLSYSAREEALSFFT